jgi:hypothetical protein
VVFFNQNFVGKRGELRTMARRMIGARMMVGAAMLGYAAGLVTPAAEARSLTAPPAARAKALAAGRLDASFGVRGKVMVPTGKEENQASRKEAGFEISPAPGGKIVVRWGRSIYRYLPNGRADLGFGQRGRIAIGTPAGIQFKPAGVTVDRRGRLIVAGTSQNPEAPVDPGPSQQLQGPSPTWATVIRYLPDGTPDPGFGDDGRIDTTLGMAPPEPRSGLSNPSPIYTYVTPAISVGAIAVDSEGRPLIAGSSVARVGYCYPGVTHYETRAYMTRLTEAGAYDVSFADSAIAETQTGDALTPTADGGWLFQGWDGVECPRADPFNQPTQIVSLTSR